MEFTERVEATHSNAGRRCVEQTRRYARTAAAAAVAMPTGAEFEPLDGIGDIDAADAEVEFTVESFGALREWLVEDGAPVGPDTAVAVVEYRAPTLAEWNEERSKRLRAESRVRELERDLANPLVALAGWWRERVRRGAPA